MLLASAEHPGRAVRVAYSLNVHPAEDLAGVRAGIDEVAVALAERLDARGAPFGVGPWLPGAVARELAADEGERRRFADELAERGLEAFTWNAFPYGGFHRPGLKEGVFRPTWSDPERLLYTEAVARIAAEAWRAAGARPRHVSISTHAGAFAAEASRGDRAAHADGLARASLALARIEEETGCRIVLSVEPEPRSTANDTGELAALHRLARDRAAGALAGEADPTRALAALDRHLGTCLDACHAAVELEDPERALANATAGGVPLGKLQHSSALRVRDPARRPAALERLLALDEPVYLHQVTARGPAGAARAADLPEAAQHLAAADPAWRDAAEWRCHFHVPVDLASLGGGDGLETTREEADLLLATACASPERWGGLDELHVELETYTWSVLPDVARGGARDLALGLEREVRHVLDVLARAGWTRAGDR